MKPPRFGAGGLPTEQKCPSSRPAGSAARKSSSALGSNDPSVEAISAGRVNGPASNVRPKRLCLSPSLQPTNGQSSGEMHCSVNQPWGTTLVPRSSRVVHPARAEALARSPMPKRQRVPHLGARKPLDRKQRRDHRPPRLTAGGARPPSRLDAACPDTLRHCLVTFREWVPLGVRLATEALLRPKPISDRVPFTTSRVQAGALLRASPHPFEQALRSGSWNAFSTSAPRAP